MWVIKQTNKLAEIESRGFTALIYNWLRLFKVFSGLTVHGSSARKWIQAVFPGCCDVSLKTEKFPEQALIGIHA